MKQCEPLKEPLKALEECAPCPPGLRNRRRMPMGHVGIVASEPVAGLWHLSAACNHTLGYYELKEIRYTFLPNAMFVAQVFPPREDFVNVHENCFHLWQLAPGGYAEYQKED